MINLPKTKNLWGLKSNLEAICWRRGLNQIRTPGEKGTIKVIDFSANLKIYQSWFPIRLDHKTLLLRLREGGLGLPEVQITIYIARIFQIIWQYYVSGLTFCIYLGASAGSWPLFAERLKVFGEYVKEQGTGEDGSHCPSMVATRQACHSEFFSVFDSLWPRQESPCWPTNFIRGQFLSTEYAKEQGTGGDGSFCLK